MKKAEQVHVRFESLSDIHRAFGLPAPKHPLVSLLNNSNDDSVTVIPAGTHVLGFYKISYKTKLTGKIKYGQGYYDFDEGGLLFAAPGQVMGTDDDAEQTVCSAYTLLVHPDFLLSYPLAKKIKQYGYFSYATHEALHLSSEEKEIIVSIFENIEKELKHPVDNFSHDVIISQLDLLLTYANRFYKRQFITRTKQSNELLSKFEEILDDYFNNDKSLAEGIPTVHYLSTELHLTPSYLSDMLRSLTGQSAQQHIHHKLIEKAKEQLSTTSLSVSEIAYQLGFEHSQSFNKLFKSKVNLSPGEFRERFN